MSSSTELGCPRSLAFGDLGQHEPRRAFFFPHPRHRITSVVFSPPMPRGLVRNQHTGNFHFITFSCFHRAPYLGSASARDLFENALERTRQRSKFVVAGYVAMPEHIHLLIGEPLKGTVARVIHALKLSVSLRRTERPFWQTRYYDFNVWSGKRSVTEKLRYMHRNPVRTGTRLQSPKIGRGPAFAITRPALWVPSRSSPHGPPPGEVVDNILSESETGIRWVALPGKDMDNSHNAGNHPWTLAGDTDSTILLFQRDIRRGEFLPVLVSSGQAVWTKKVPPAPMATKAVHMTN